MSREHVGTWTGPGMLALLDGDWIYFTEQDAPRDLRARAAALVGLDGPRIAIRLVAEASRKARPHQVAHNVEVHGRSGTGPDCPADGPRRGILTGGFFRVFGG